MIEARSPSGALQRSDTMHDFCVIGGGIVGLATAMILLERQPGATLVLIEKEAGFARHQTGHNSGVIHAGVYYAPGSLKAKLCREGAAATKAFCRREQLPFEECGKLLVATSEPELARMDALFTRAQENGIDVTRLSGPELSAAEPAIVGLGALRVASTGIVDYVAVCQAMARRATALGAELRLSTPALAHPRVCGAGVEVDTPTGLIRARKLVACAGLQSDRLARMAGFDIDFAIVPFRGEYFALPQGKSNLIRHLIYPIPDPELPFLGIHLTRMIDGRITVGPNAVLGFAREGYAPLSFDRRDMLDMARFPGFWRVLRDNLGSGVKEFRNSFSRAGYLAECRKYCPELTLDDLTPYPAGIRAQAVKRSGELVHDFLFAQSERSLHVCNAPSPAATSAIPIASMIADKLLGGSADRP